MLTLPDEIILTVVDFVESKSIPGLASVCKKLKILIEEKAPAKLKKGREELIKERHDNNKIVVQSSVDQIKASLKPREQELNVRQSVKLIAKVEEIIQESDFGKMDDRYNIFMELARTGVKTSHVLDKRSNSFEGSQRNILGGMSQEDKTRMREKLKEQKKLVVQQEYEITPTGGRPATM